MDSLWGPVAATPRPRRRGRDADSPWRRPDPRRGCSVETCPRLRYGVEILEWKAGAPRIAADSPPLLAIAGTNDTVIVPENSEWLCARYAGVGADCELHLLDGWGHDAWNATLPGSESQNHRAVAFLEALVAGT